MRIMVYSKRWSNKKVAEVRKIETKNNRRLSKDKNLKNKLRQAHNLYYRTIKKAKRL